MSRCCRAQLSEDGTRRELWAADVSWSMGKRAQRRQRGASGRRKLGRRPWEVLVVTPGREHI